MKGLAITNIGIEDITASEIKQLTNAKTTEGEGFVVFETEKDEDFFKICYKCQSVLKVLLLLSEFKINSIEDINTQIQKINLDEWIKDSTFVVRSETRNSTLPKLKIEPETGAFIFKKTNAEVNLHTPDTTFFVFTNKDDCFIGVDFSGADLGKRDYRIFTGKESLKPTVAYALTRIAGFNEKDSLLDPFCRAGTISIETTLSAVNFPVNYFSKDKFLFLKLKKFENYDFEKFFDEEDKEINSKIKLLVTAADSSFQSISAAKKNAKIAGIEKKLNFSRKQPEWLDSKFKEHELDMIVSFPPQKGKSLSEKSTAKIYNELFYQADFILKKEGAVTLLLKETEIAETEAKKYDFKIKSKRKIMQGKEEFFAVVFSK